MCAKNKCLEICYLTCCDPNIWDFFLFYKTNRQISNSNNNTWSFATDDLRRAPSGVSYTN